jgi:hypothetical protein
LSTTAPTSIPPAGSAPQGGTVGPAGSYEWRATQPAGGDPNTYRLTSTGTVNGRVRTVTETVTRPARYPFALFAKDGLYFNGQSAAAGAIYAEKAGTLDPSRKAGIGSNRAVVIGSHAGGGDAQTYYSPDGSCGGCPNPLSAAGPYDAESLTAPSTGLACPGTPPGLVDGTETLQTINPGVYLCADDLTLAGNVSVGSASGANPVVIYVAGDLHLAGLTMSPSSDPTGLQILMVGAGRIDTGGSLNGARFTGIIDAPAAYLTSSSCSMSIVGALVVDVFSCGGTNPPNFSLAYDDRVQALLSDAWRASNYHEIPTPASL